MIGDHDGGGYLDCLFIFVLAGAVGYMCPMEEFSKGWLSVQDDIALL